MTPEPITHSIVLLQHPLAAGDTVLSDEDADLTSHLAVAHGQQDGKNRQSDTCGYQNPAIGGMGNDVVSGTDDVLAVHEVVSVLLSVQLLNAIVPEGQLLCLEVVVNDDRRAIFVGYEAGEERLVFGEAGHVELL